MKIKEINTPKIVASVYFKKDFIDVILIINLQKFIILTTNFFYFDKHSILRINLI